jgi:hypothetical protein
VATAPTAVTLAPIDLLSPERHFTAADLGLPEHAVFRCFAELPQNAVAVGSDYGLVIFQGDSFKSFPFPKGARREMRDILDLAWDGTCLHIVSAKNAYRWNLEKEIHTLAFPKDGKGGFEELRCVLAGPKGLIEAWRTRWVSQGRSHPAEDILCMATDMERVFFGSRNGQLGVLDGEVLHNFEHPIRHLAWAHDRLWIAAAKSFWTLVPGESPIQIEDREPFGLCTDPHGRLWRLHATGPGYSGHGEVPKALNLQINRPWSIGANKAGLWVGQRGGLSRWLWDPESHAG